MTTGAAHEYLARSLRGAYDAREAVSVADLVMESRLGLTRMDRIVRRTEPLPAAQVAQLEADLAELLRHRPVQYVLGEAWFDGLLLRVTEDVLIPRPETEELVHWIAEDAGALGARPGTAHRATPHSAAPDAALRILDIGTGSGCIPVALQKRLPSARIHALDVSPGALAVARGNAARQNAPIGFIQANFLDETTWATLPETDILVSNPPYIAENEKTAMHDRVLTQEPHLALFVPDNDPLIFYRTIARFARKGMTVYVEINEALGAETAALFEAEGLQEVSLRKDMQGKDRMIRARR